MFIRYHSWCPWQLFINGTRLCLWISSLLDQHMNATCQMGLGLRVEVLQFWESWCFFTHPSKIDNPRSLRSMVVHRPLARRTSRSCEVGWKGSSCMMQTLVQPRHTCRIRSCCWGRCKRCCCMYWCRKFHGRKRDYKDCQGKRNWEASTSSLRASASSAADGMARCLRPWLSGWEGRMPLHERLLGHKNYIRLAWISRA
jgi:hypothetical protein